MQPVRRAVLTSTGPVAARKPSSPFSSGLGCATRPQQQQQQQQQQRRPFSRSAPRHAAPPPPAPARSGIAALTSRKLISISGPDAAKFLQGVVTVNMLTAGPEQQQQQQQQQPPPLPPRYALFLTAQGRLLHDVFIYPDPRRAGEGFLLEVDAAEAESLQKHIRRYKLRAKFDVRVLADGEGAVWHAWNDDSSSSSTAGPGLPPSAPGAATVLTARDTRAPGLGHRIVTLDGAGPPDQALPAVPEQAYHLRRYLRGVAEGQAELAREQALPHESNADVCGAVDFRKGCYVGQELTIRTEHRGVVRKRVLPCLLYPCSSAAPPERLTDDAYRPAADEPAGLGAEMVPAGASIGRVGKKGRSAGKWLRGVGNVGLALCRLEIMTDVVLPGETVSGGFDPADEFVVSLGGPGGAAEGEGGEAAEEGTQKVKIKAFVPDWLRERLANKGAH